MKIKNLPYDSISNLSQKELKNIVGGCHGDDVHLPGECPCYAVIGGGLKIEVPCLLELYSSVI